MNKNDISITITQEDLHSNDYLYVWNFFKQKPSKLCYYENFDTNKFHNFIDSYKNENACSIIEIYPLDNDTLITNKKLIKIDNLIFVSYTLVESDKDNVINDIIIYYLEKNKDFVEIFITKLNESVDNLVSEIASTNTFVLKLENSLFEKEPTQYVNSDFQNIDLYYNDDTLKKLKKLSKNIKKYNKGISIIHGERGVGKTSLVNYLSKNSDRDIVFIPCYLFETTIVNPEFRNFLIKNPNIIVILDDADIYFSEIYSKSNIFTNNILQFVDGLDSDSFNLHILAILNVANVEDIDHILLQCNNLLDVIEIKELEIKKVKALSKHLKNKNNFDQPTKLINILKKSRPIDCVSEIGF